MRNKYIISESASEKLKNSGLSDKISEIEKSEDGLGYLGGCIRKEDIAAAVNEMREEGFYKTLPKEEGKTFKANLNKIFQDENSRWKIERENKTIEEKIEPEDFFLLTGYVSSFVLGPEEIWDYKKFGFSSLNDFVGSFGALVWLKMHKDFHNGYKWRYEKDSRIYETEITGDINLDLRIYRRDVTPDKTFDPTGVEVSFRPVLETDRFAVIGYHSTEPSLLVGVLKYAEQTGLQPQVLCDNARQLKEYLSSLGHTVGNATECFGSFGGLNENPQIILSHYNFPMPRLNENLFTENGTVYFIGTQFSDPYGMFVGPNNELIFSHGKIYDKGEVKPSMTIYPEEIDEMLKGICYQCAKGLGRTFPQLIMNILDYRYSEKFVEDQEYLRNLK